MLRQGKCLLLLTIVAIVLSNYPMARLAAASQEAKPLNYSAPTAPGTGYYVPPNWNDTVPGQWYTYAYADGYNADPGSADQYGRGIVVLDFGRQTKTYDPNTGQDIWQNILPDSNITVTTASWVKSAVQWYMRGYQDGPHRTSVAVIVVGTSNDNWNWDCTNGGYVSPLWYYAGQAWGGLIQSLQNDLPSTYNKVILRSGNDFEDWTEVGDPWIACGTGAEKWYDGYEYYTSIGNKNFGNDPSSTSTQWTSNQVWLVSYGRITAYALPEIYCPTIVYNGTTYPGDATKWLNIRVAHSMQFDGVTSNNTHGTCTGGGTTYTWWDSWNSLNNALGTTYANNLASTTVVFPH